MCNTTRREVARRERCRGDAKPSRLPLGWGAPAPEGSGCIRTPRLLRSVKNKRLHPSIISRLDGGFIFYTVATVAREDGRSAKFHPSGRLAPLVSILSSHLVPALLVRVVGGPTGVEVPGVSLAPVGLALHFHPLPASLRKLLLFPSLHLIQGGARRHRAPRIWVPKAPLVCAGLLGYEAGLGEPPLAFCVDVPLAQSVYLLGYLLFSRSFRPASLSPLGWLRRHASCRSLERRSLSSRCSSSLSRESLSRSWSLLLVMLALPFRLRWSAHPLRRLPICLAPLPMSPQQRTPDPRALDL